MTKPPPIITAKQIVELLSEKHSKDVFVPECKDGPTQGVVGHMRRMDAWVMTRSWAHPRTIAYEVKVDRNDFLKDVKWRDYLACCSELYFVAPKGLISVGELASEAGLIEVVGTKRLVTRKASPSRDVQVAESVYRYILMCRAKIGNDNQHAFGDFEAEKIRRFAWIEENEAKAAFGHDVSKKLRQRYERDVIAGRRENKDLAERMREYDDVRTFLASIGIDPEKRVSEWSVRRRLEEDLAAQSVQVLDSIAIRARNDAERLKDLMAKLTQERNIA